MSELEPMIQAAVAAAMRKTRAPETRWASVYEYDPDSEQTQVTVDGDDDPVSATNATGTGFAVGQRVFVLHSPPSGLHVIGYRPAPPIEYTPVLENVDVGDGSVYGEYVYSESGLIDYAVVAELGTGASVTGTIGVSLPVIGSELNEDILWLSVGRALIAGNGWTGSAPYQPAVSTESITNFRSDGMGNWTTAVPDAWAAGDVLRITGRYPRRLVLQDDTAE